jgi:DNA-binding protein H-NS
MAKTYADIQKEIESLQKAAESLRQKEVAGVIERIKSAIKTYDLTARDLGFASRTGAVAAPKKTRATKRGKTDSVARYRDAASGKTWSGRGRRPGWVLEALKAGKSLDDLRA